MSTTKESGSTFTARDFELLSLAMGCTKSPLEIDYKKFAEKAGFKGGPSGKAAWHSLKKKIEKVSAGGSTVTPSLTISEGDEGKKSGGKKRKAAAAAEGDDDEAAEADESSGGEEGAKKVVKKKGRKAPAVKGAGNGKKGKAAAAPAAAVEEDQDDDEDVGGQVKGEEMEE